MDALQVDERSSILAGALLTSGPRGVIAPMFYDVTLYRLKVFTLIVEAHGVGAAADALGLTQPSISRHLRGLEAAAGQPLFDRHPGKALELTDAGRALYRYAHEAVLGAENLANVFADLEAGRRGHVVMGVTRGLAHSAMVPLLAEHARRSPSVLITMQSGTLAEVVTLVEKGDVAFGLVTTVGPVEPLRSVVIRSVPLLVISAPSHPLADRRFVTPDDVLNEPCVVPYRQSSHYKLVFGLARQAGWRFRNLALEVDDGQVMSNVVRQTGAVAVALESGVEEDLNEGRLVALRLDPPLPSLELRLVSRNRRRFSSAEERLMSMVIDHFGNVVADAEQVGAVVEHDSPAGLLG